MDKAWRKIKQTGNYAYLDTLDGVVLKDKELLQYRFPDGTVVLKPVRVKKWTDEGIKDDIHMSDAYLDYMVHGVEASIRATELLVRRVWNAAS